MAAMTTALTEFSDKENSRVYTLNGHTASKKQKLIQRRKEAIGNKVVMEDSLILQYGTEDADGAVMPQAISFTVTVARPVGYLAADMTAALASIRDIVAGDEFTSMVNGQQYLK